MSQSEPSIFLFIVIGGLGSIAGYLLRIVQKYEERKDEIFLQFLPALDYNIYFFKESVEFFCDDNQLMPFKEKIKKINDGLTEQVFSGNILFLDTDFQKMLSEFYITSKKFQSVLDRIEDNDEHAKILKFAFENETDFLGINPSKLVEDAIAINDLAESNLKNYKSFSYFLIIFIFALGATIAAIEYFKT